MTTLTLIRGLPGSGKSTHARSLIDGWHFAYSAHRPQVPIHLEADMYFTRNGEYKFDGDMLKYAHSACLDACDALLALNRSVIVSNTFTTIKELQPYVHLMEGEEEHLRIIEMKGSYGSIHNVPEEAMQRMRNRWETLPADWVKFRVEHE